MMRRGLVSVGWLAQQLKSSQGTSLRVLDASFHLPTAKRDAHAEYMKERIPAAGFFDVAKIADVTQPYPHMLPSAPVFEQAMTRLRVTPETHVVVYDCSDLGLFSAARLWWTMRIFGHERVSVLDGGMAKWRQEQLPLETGTPTLENVPATPPYVVSTFHRQLLRTYPQIMATLNNGQEYVMDARSAGRFSGKEPEPRPGISSGHMPNSVNTPFMAFVDPQTKTLRSDDEIKAIFAKAGVDKNKPWVASCASGVTACVVALAAHVSGAAPNDVAIYDGSWSEYAVQPNAKIEKSV